MLKLPKVMPHHPSQQPRVRGARRPAAKHDLWATHRARTCGEIFVAGGRRSPLQRHVHSNKPLPHRPCFGCRV